jgi:signal transduction histidine kinase
MNKIIVAWVSIALAILIAGYFLTYQEELRVNLDRIARTQAILSILYDLENNLAEAEAVMKGFIITGDDQQLQAYPYAIREIERRLHELGQAVADEPEERRLLDSLRPLIAKILALFDQSITLRREKGFEGWRPTDLAREEGKIRGRIHKIFNDLEDLEKKQLDPGWARQKERLQFWLASLTVGMFVSFGILIVVLSLLNNEVRQRKKAEDQVADYQADLRSLASQLTLAEERERRRLAMHLHDQIGQTLALSNIKLHEARASLPPEVAPHLSQELAHIGGLLEKTIEETRSLTFKISPPILYELGLEAALEWLTERFGREHGLLTFFESDRQPKSLDEDLKILVFQAVQELLVNVVKHANARNLKVSVWREGDILQVGVEDDGVGFNPQDLGLRHGEGGFGLFSIRERLRPLGGNLRVSSEPGQGTEVTLSVPLSGPMPVASFL